jgi:hypothetical protein
MEADRTFIAKDGTKIEEFFWGGKVVCYVNNCLSTNTFEEELDKVKSEESK